MRRTTYAIVSLGFVTAANFGTTTAGIYASAIGLRNFSALQRRSWTTLLLITITPVALVGIFIPELFFAKFGSFLALIGVAFAPLCGIQMIDYFVLRRRRIDIRAIYSDEPGGAYYFWRGMNPAALLALASGCCTYVLLLNPLSYRSSGWYAYSTASLPAAAAAALVYLLASQFIIRGGSMPRWTSASCWRLHSPGAGGCHAECRRRPLYLCCTLGYKLVKAERHLRAFARFAKTLTLNVKATIKPCDRDSDKAPTIASPPTVSSSAPGPSRTARETGAEYL